MKNCETCAWYCHTDGMCYAPLYTNPVEIPEWWGRRCLCWTADGLTKQEREDLDALVTMEKA